MNGTGDYRFPSFGSLVGASPIMKGIFHKIELYGSAEAPVVITGETGTGKDLVAREIHRHSPRAMMPFVAVNCCALSEDLFESELFGHEKGSFTGAIKTHKGRFERANKGTLFLDEIGDMPPRTQAKLLRVLEEGTIERVGGEEPYPVDVRIVAATNISLEQAVAVRQFRSDLYHRLAVFRIHVPPLRERVGDIELLVNYYLRVLNNRYNRQVVSLTPEALSLLKEYHWPGNIRELRNVLERVYVETHGSVIGHNALNDWIRERDYFAAGDWNVYYLENQTAVKPAIIVPHYPLDSKTATEANYRVSHYPGEVALLPLKTEAPGLGNEHRGVTPLALPVLVNKDRIFPPSQRGEAPPIDIVYKPPGDVARPRELTKDVIQQTFQKAHGNITQAARLLGIHKATLYRHMKSLGLSRESLSTRSPQYPSPDFVSENSPK